MAIAQLNAVWEKEIEGVREREWAEWMDLK